MAKAAVSELTLPRPLFEYSVAWGETYRALFSGKASTVTDINSIIKRSAISGRVLLCGRAGSGKSIIMRRLAKRASDDGAIVVFIDLSKWAPLEAANLTAKTDEPVAWMNFLIERFSTLDATLLSLDMASPSALKMIFVDGLNEVPPSAGNVILGALDETVTRLIESRVIVADRLTRRPIREDRWKLARVEPLSNAAIEKASANSGGRRSRRLRSMTSQRLLDWPFFLAKALDDGHSSESGVDALRQFFKERIGLSDVELARVACASYLVYVEAKSRTFPAPGFSERVGKEVFDKLVHAGALETADHIAHFKHHLHHDFLAAKYVAAENDEWGYRGFDNLTFQASSFDSIALAFAQVAEEAKPTFVRRVYDWNPYAIAFALAEDEYRQADDLDWEIEEVILSMLTEKRWDPVIPTAERASDALSLFPRSKSLPFLTLNSLQELLNLVSRLTSEVRWFNEWKQLFCLPSGELVSDQVIARLRDVDSIVGWTLANVLKRLALSQHQLRLVRDFSRSDRAVVRWRSIHVLGAFPSEESIAVAFDLLDTDADTWVRYGAVRSVVEMAAKADGEIRARILKGIVDRRASILADSRLRDELVRALRIQPARTSRDWAHSALQVLLQYMEASTSVEDIDYWSRAMRRVRSERVATAN